MSESDFGFYFLQVSIEAVFHRNRKLVDATSVVAKPWSSKSRKNLTGTNRTGLSTHSTNLYYCRIEFRIFWSDPNEIVSNRAPLPNKILTVHSKTITTHLLIMSTLHSSRDLRKTAIEKVLLLFKPKNTLLFFFVASLPITCFFSEVVFLMPPLLSSSNATSPKNYATNNMNEFHPIELRNKVTLSTRRPRRDRMGSRIQLPLTVWAYARHKNYSACFPEEPMAVYLSFPICPPGFREGQEEFQDDNLTRMDFDPNKNITDKPGIYFVSDNRNPLINMMMDYEYDKNDSLWTNSTIHEWRNMILKSPPRNSNSWLWTYPQAFHIAVHVRRGDITPDKRNDIFVTDDVFIAQIEMVKRYIKIIRGNDVKMEVHVFSEAYGTTDWPKYGDLVHQFHLAPVGSSDIGLSVRDWKHFITADVMVIGGTFSRIPSLARSNGIDDGGKGGGAGVSMTLCQHEKKYFTGCRKDWVHWKYGRNREEVIVDFPSITMVASSPANADLSVGEENFVFRLCEECLLASVRGMFSCVQRIQKYMKEDSMELKNARLLVTNQYPSCSVCNPATCHFAGALNETFSLRNDWNVTVFYKV